MSVAQGLGGYRHRQPSYNSKRHDRTVARLKANVRQVKSGIATNNEEHFRHSRRHYINRRANPYRDARNTEIAKSNRHLVGHIAGAHTDYAFEEPFKVPSLNYNQRKMERDRIHKENLTMAGRIIESQIRTSYQRRKELDRHSRKQDLLIGNIGKVIPTGPRRGYHEYIAGGYSRSAPPKGSRPQKRVTGKDNMGATSGPMLPPLNEARDKAKAAGQKPAPQMPEVVTLGSAINSFITMDPNDEKREAVALTAKGADSKWRLTPAPPGTNASPTVPPLYHLLSTTDRWLSAETTGTIYTSESPGWGNCTSKWVLEDVGAGRYRMGAWRNEDTTAPGGYMCIDPLGKLSVMRPPEDKEEAANAKSLFHWQIDG